MPDSTLSQALQEAYASAKGMVYHTIELRHASFTAPIRVVRDFTNLTSTLEATAPANPSESVEFIAMAFDFTKPEISPTGIPQITLTLDNVSREITSSIEQATQTPYPVEITYREFIEADLSGPQNDPPLTMQLLTCHADVFQVTATAGLPNWQNKKFPTEEYGTERFPGLIA